MTSIVKPKNDKQEYRFLHLENGLEVLLVHDAESDKCAAALDVKVGYFSDPEALPGLSHFLEHMLFYASEKYPTEDAFMKFCTENGGYCNAYTTSEDTCYYMMVNHNALEGALDRFAQFFLAPTISKDGVEREVKAVDSEHRRNLSEDVWKRQQILKTLASPAHPFHRFSTGSLETLWTEPGKKGVDVHAEVLRHYETHYCSSLMRLCVVGRDSLGALEALVRPTFEGVKHRGNPRYRPPTSIFPDSFPGSLVLVVPTKDVHELRLFWEVPLSPEEDMEYAPADLLSHLLGHEGEGSVYSALKKKGWASGLSCASHAMATSTSFFVSVAVTMTEAGNEHVSEVSSHILSYVEMLRASSRDDWERLFQELASLRRLKFDTRDKPSDPSSLATSAAALMQVPGIESQNLLLHLYHVPLKYSREKVEEVLAFIQPYRAFAVWSSWAQKPVADLAEPIYGTNYTTRTIPAASWGIADPPVAASLGLHLPEANPFIASDLSVAADSHPEEAGRGAPRIVYESDMATLYYQMDSKFRVPKAFVSLALDLPSTFSSPEATSHLVLYCDMLSDRINETAYQAELAGLNFNLSAELGIGLNATLSGYADKLAVLVDKVFSAFVSLEFTDEELAVSRERALRRLANFRKEQPHSLCRHAFHITLSNSNPLEASEAFYTRATPERLRKTLPLVMAKVGIRAFATGSLSPAAAAAVVQRIEGLFRDRLGARGLLSVEKAARRSPVLLPGDLRHSQECPEPTQVNSAALMVLQAEQDSPRSNVLVQLLTKLGRQEAFYELRTREQLGYICTMGHERTFGGSYCLYVTVQSLRPATYLEERIEAFLDTFRGKLAGLPAEEFEAAKKALEVAKLKRSDNLFEEAGILQREIRYGTFQFDRQEREVAELRTVTQGEMVAFFERVALGEGRRRIAYCVEGLGGKQEQAAAAAAAAPENGASASEAAEKVEVGAAKEGTAKLAAEAEGPTSPLVPSDAAVENEGRVSCGLSDTAASGALEPVGPHVARARAARDVKDLVGLRRGLPLLPSLL